ncbi:MAG: tetratricopeptide repeat protein [Bryobacteraceae bacterium]
MKRAVLALTTAAVAVFLMVGSPDAGPAEDRLWHHRNLGKAFYENPTTQIQAVDEFKKALDLAPDSARERLNYGLSLLRAGKTKEGIDEIEKAQKQDPKIPHTWFNLGVAFKKESEYERAIQQFEQMVKLVPDEPVSHYNLGVLYKLTGKTGVALKSFEMASRLNPNLAGPHFQLYNAYRQAGRAEDAARELKIFQEIKKRQVGAAVPEDLEWSFFSEIYETIDPRSEPAAEAAVIQLQEQKVGKPLDAATAGLAVIDLDGDGQLDLLVWSASAVQAFKNGTAAVGSLGIDAKDVQAVVPGDWNNDALADLAVLTKSGATLYTNQKGAFAKHAAQLPAGSYSAAVWMDYDHDYDIDLFLLGEKSVLVRNNGTAGFSQESFPFVAGRALSGTMVDAVADTDGFDLAVTYDGRATVLYRDKLAGKYEALPLDAVPAGAKGLIAFDFNNDSWTDLAFDSGLAVNRNGAFERAALPDGAKGPVVFADLANRGAADLIAGGSVYRNHGLAKFERVHEGAPSNALAAADFNGDGRQDLAAVRSDGALVLLRNQTATRNSFLRIALTGVKNLKLAPGAEVEVKAATRYQKRIYTGLPLTFGLGSFKEADTVRITWPNGLIQNEPKQATGKAMAYKEAQRLSGSCPMIFTWNGEAFEYITDVLGVAPLGASAGGGEYFPVDHDEYVQIAGESLALADGRYEIRITEELREISYLDQIQLTAVDHPADVAIVTNDKFKAPPFPEFRLFGVKRPIRPKAARDHRGRDVLRQVLKRDGTYPDSYARDYGGVAELHHLDLDFGREANQGVLVLSGWVDWADGSTFLGAAQADPNGLVMPYLQVKDAEGQWKTVIEDMGIPAGKPKTIAVDLTGKFLSASREVRIVTSLCVYWDEIYLSEDTAEPEAVLTAVLPETADLRFRGFSKPTVHPERKQPETFNYAKWMPTSMWNPTPGNYTRLGDVRPLLESIDDKLVIMGAGDELRLLFPAGDLPPLKAGWKRDFLLFVDGWAKDGDANTAYSKSVEPLPFHGMSAYPYPAGERFPDTAAHRAYRAEYNTRPALRIMRSLAEAPRRQTEGF